MKKILLNYKGAVLYALVSDQDFELVNKHKWSVAIHGKYFRLSTTGSIIMSRLIMKVKDRKIYVDHIDGDTLDNRRENLRLSNATTNQYNRRKFSITASKYKGVTPYQYDKTKWVARSFKDGKSHHLGIFDKETDAAKAYDRSAIELFGEFAKPNFSNLKPK